MKSISLVNGDSKPIEFYYLGGGYLCPWCSYPVVNESGNCENPGCFCAYKTVEALQVALNKEAERLAAEAERQKLLEIRNRAYGRK